MSQKELSYLEDIYNHELLISKVIVETMNLIDDDTYYELLNKHKNEHDILIKELVNLLEVKS